ncbi:MAG: hypothetical protein DRP84_06815 [Spirochaetes bacterium]|nr:MAG: hypothetical protein DRP84_06815 [Spirochaetota bacterium]
MEIRIQEEKGEIIVKLIGDVFVEQGDELMDAFNSVLEKKPESITIDMGELKSISSSGIGKIVMLFKEMNKKGGKVKIVGVNDTIMQIFKIVKLDKLMEIEPLPKE